MAEETEIKPIAAEPPKVNPLAGLKLPTQNALKPGLKLPTQNALKPGLKLPTQNALKPGLKMPAKPVIRKPGATVTAIPLPKPTLPKPVEAGKTVEAAKPADAAKPAEVVQPMEQLKAVTQKLKGITQEIPQQAILRKTGIIADAAMTEAQKEAAKHKTARISLSDAMGVAPVKNENAPMKTIRIKRPIDIPGSTASLKPQPAPAAPAALEAKAAEPAATTETPAATSPTSTITQRKTLKIARPGGGAVRPTGKFGIKRPTAQTAPAAPAAAAPAADTSAETVVADIADIPSTVAPLPAAKPADEGPAWLWTLSTVVQAAACVAIAALAWMLFQNTQVAYY